MKSTTCLPGLHAILILYYSVPWAQLQTSVKQCAVCVETCAVCTMCYVQCQVCREACADGSIGAVCNMQCQACREACADGSIGEGVIHIENRLRNPCTPCIPPLSPPPFIRFQPPAYITTPNYPYLSLPTPTYLPTYPCLPLPTPTYQLVYGL